MMNRLIKVLLWFFIIIAILAVSGFCYVMFFLPKVGKAQIMTIERTPERIARGKYLANHITNCMDCHSKRDWTRFAGPATEGTFGMGGDLFDKKFGFPGRYYAKNITPEGISRYTDGELFRVITTGVNKEGEALFPVMPYHYYGQMDQEDIKSIIAYVRTLKRIKNAVPNSTSDFPMNFIINTIPHEANFTIRPPKTDVVNYGKYIVNAASCVECHTKFEKGSLVAETEFGGGRDFPFPDGSVVHSSNISPDKETGLGVWTDKMFLDLFHSRSDSTTLNTKLKPGDFNTTMPWTMYGKMTDEDLRAIFAYLKTVKPIKNKVVSFTPSPKQK